MKREVAKTTEALDAYVAAIKLLEAQEMPDEVSRTVLTMFDQLVVRGVSPEKAAYTCAMTYVGFWHKGVPHG